VAAPDSARLQVPPRFNLAGAMLARRLDAGDGQKIAVEYEGRAWSYADIADLSRRAASVFRELKIGREQRVLIALPDSPEFIAAFLGAMLAGAVAVPSSTFLGSSDYDYFLRATSAHVVVTTPELLEKMHPSAAQVEAVLLVGRDRGQEDHGPVRSWQRLIDAASPIDMPADTHKDEPAFWLWTSGSTGEPKAVVHLHQDAPWCCRGVAEDVLGMTAADRVYSAAKLFHAYGLNNALLFPFWVGATTILHPGRSLQESVFGVIDAKQPTIFFGVPTLFALLLQVQDAERRFNLSSVRFCVSAGEPLPAEIYHRWLARFGVEILDGIGSTELLNMYICSRPGQVRPGSSGQVVPGYAVRIVDEHGRDVPAGVIGDLLVSGPSCAIMYWNQRDQTKARMRGEWFVSGDKYTVDEEGYYWYAGRSDDMFKASGEWISPTEVESLLMQHEAVVECAVVGWEEGTGVIKPKAFVVLTAAATGGPEMVRALQDFVRARAAHYKCPRTIEFIAELPKTATGKIQRFRLRQPGG
jgi:benzoate-CoA ligase family protein